jgi:hypothetical protein
MKYGVITHLALQHCIVSVVVRKQLQADEGKGCSDGGDVHWTVYIACSLTVLFYNTIK